jgi:serine/threonine-protein kinase HipA
MDAESVIAEFVESAPGAIASANAALPAGFPNQVADAMLDGASRSAAKLAAMSLG